MTGHPELTGLSVVDLAATAREAVRQINHLTIRDGDVRGYRYAGDAFDVLADLAALVHGLRQALRQLAGRLDRASVAGAVRHDAVNDREASQHAARIAVLDIADALNAATARLAQAGQRMQTAAEVAAHLAAFDDEHDDQDEHDDETAGGRGAVDGDGGE